MCVHPQKSGALVMSAIQEQHTHFVEEKKFYSQLVDLLSYEKIIFSDLQMKPYRTDEYVQKLFYETARFSAFNHQFAVKARINNSQRDPHQSNDRHLSYQLILKTKTTTPLSIHFFVLKGPFSDTKMETKIYKHDFTDTVRDPLKIGSGMEWPATNNADLFCLLGERERVPDLPAARQFRVQ